MRNCSLLDAFFLLRFEQVTLLQSHLHTLVGFMRLRLKEQVNTMPTNAECTQHDFTEIYSPWHLVSTAKVTAGGFSEGPAADSG